MLARRTGALLLAAALVSVVSVPAAGLAQMVIIVLAVYDHRRAATPTVRRRVRGSWALNAVGTVELCVDGAAGRIRITDDLGPGLERLPPLPTSPVLDGSTTEGVTFESTPGQETNVGYRVALRRRGDLRFGAIHIRSLGPWGLAWRQTTLDTEDKVRVQPGIEELRQERLPALRPDLAAGPRRTRRWGEGSEFESLREYRPGDDPRTVDWKASAKRPELLVRNYQVERNQNVVLAIDAGRLMREWIGDRERLDYALSSALVLAERARSYGDRVGLLVFDDQVRSVMPAGRVRLAALADALAGVEARLVEPNYPIAFATLRRTFKKRSLIIVFSDIIDGSASRALVQGLVGTAARHLPVVVAIRNPDVDAAAAGQESEQIAPFRRAAAEELIEARAKALQTMRRAGVQTVDVLPGAACGAVLAKYAEIKGRGLL